MAQRKPQDLVFLLDVDNTLLDNDRSKEDIQAALLKMLGEEGATHFWKIYEDVRKQVGVVDYPETLVRFAHTWEDKKLAQKVADLINNWPYRDYVYPGSFPALKHLTELGEVAILSDGDTDYQPRKIASAGLAHAVGGPQDVLIFTHKENNIDDIMKELPGKQYVFIDDKEKILASLKERLGDRATTIWVKQGHYAADPAQYRKPDPDITIDAIGDLCSFTRSDFEGKKEGGET